MAAITVRERKARPGRLGAANLIAAAATDLAKQSGAAIPLTTPPGALNCSGAQLEATTLAERQAGKLDEFAAFAASVGAAGSALAQRVATARETVAKYEKAARAVCVNAGDANATGDAGLGVKATAGADAAAIDAGSTDTGGASAPGLAELQALADAQEAANEALEAVQAETARAAATRDYYALQRQPATFGDCVVPVPVGITNRQVVVDVQMTPFEPCTMQPSNPSCPQASADTGIAQGDGAASPATPPTPDAGGERGSLHALVYADIDHGKYYWDIGVLFAVVPMGQRTVSTPQVPGLPGSHMIAVDERGTTLTGIALNAYPLGHRREAYSFLEGRPKFWRSFGDAFGLQIALNPDLTNATSTVFGGLLFEPITGLSLNGGLALLQGDFLKAGYTPGMAPPADRDDYVARSTMLRFYFGVTLGYELVHTTAAQLPTIKSDLGE